MAAFNPGLSPPAVSIPMLLATGGCYGFAAPRPKLRIPNLRFHVAYMQRIASSSRSCARSVLSLREFVAYALRGVSGSAVGAQAPAIPRREGLGRWAATDPGSGS